MGRFSMRVELANHEDVMRAELGQIAAAEVRRVEIDGVVDTGATRLVLPKAVVQKLGLKIEGKAKVRFADGRRAMRSMARYVRLQMLDREGVFNAIVEPGRTDALIGAIVLEDLDLVVDVVTGTCHPRDPHQIFSEVE